MDLLIEASIREEEDIRTMHLYIFEKLEEYSFSNSPDWNVSCPLTVFLSLLEAPLFPGMMHSCFQLLGAMLPREAAS